MKQDLLLRNLGFAIQRRRQQLNVSQTEVAERAGLSRTYFSDIENARRNFSVKTLSAIAAALDMDGSQLLSLAEEITVGMGDGAGQHTARGGTLAP